MTGGEESPTAEERIAAFEAALADRDTKLAERDAQIEALQKQLSELVQRLAQNSTNSHLPPSSDGPGARSKPKDRSANTRSGRKRGGQKGRKGVRRELVDSSSVDEVINFFPEACLGCAAELPRIHDPEARRYQQVDLVEYGPWLTEYRRNCVLCVRCGTRSRAEYDPKKIPSTAFGPRLTSVVVMLTGVYHISRFRTTQLIADMFGISISVGTVSAMEARAAKAFEPVHDEVKRVIERASVKYADATAWLREGKTKSLWTVSVSAATVYEIFEDGASDTIRPLFGAFLGVLVTDRASVFGFWAMVMRQICWSHLIRKFVSFSERDGPAGDLGRELLDCAGLIFDYWRGFKSDDLTREQLIEWMRPVQQHLESALERAENSELGHVSGSCANMLAHRDALWTFVSHEGVDPTNNDAERQLRPLVLWRKRSFGSKSEVGERFVARVMTVAQTARKQAKDLLDFFEQVITAKLEGRAPPRLIRAT